MRAGDDLFVREQLRYMVKGDVDEGVQIYDGDSFLDKHFVVDIISYCVFDRTLRNLDSFSIYFWVTVILKEGTFWYYHSNINGKQNLLNYQYSSFRFSNCIKLRS